MATQVIDLTKPIIVTMESFSLMKKLKVVDKDGDMIEINLIECDTISRNQTYYGKENTILAMKERRFAERLDQKCLFSEAEHPADVPSGPGSEQSYLQRLTRVEPSRICARIDRWWDEGNIIKGVIQWAGPFGEMYKDLVVNHGSNIAASIRAYTPNYVKKTDSSGRFYVEKTHPFFITTYDLVMLPGLEGARIVKPVEFAQQTRDERMKGPISGSTSSENYNILSSPTMKQVTFKDPVSEIRSIIRSGEESSSIISDLFGIDLSTAKMIISKNNTLTTISTEGQRIDIPLSSAILAELL